MGAEPHDPYPEEQSVSDWLVPTTKGAAGAVPIIGGLLGEIVGFIWTPALQQRQTEWFKRLAERVSQLEGKVEDLRERLQREQVLTVAVNAARAATATHEEEKRGALRNAVINSALNVEPDELMQLVFVGMVDRLTAGHLLMLELFDSPIEFFERRVAAPPAFSLTSSLGQLIKTAFPEWDVDLYGRLASDLDQEGLAHASGLGTTMSAGGAMQSRTTSLGKRFMRFIRSP